MKIEETINKYLQEATTGMDKQASNLNKDEKDLLAFAINQFGDSQHPWATANNISGFDLDYAKEVLNTAIKKYPNAPTTKKAKVLLKKLEK